ncbi:hypothetical protein QC762_0067150 [Podospora pseudocomata]|uniref:Uncharacterized protein n=1 Tax=Podospora pseudocomata TaxID=2093779 RepID=A0ABR0GFW9_9PEZI|nr:hypothetical protein QC762_0067150 [Podospora pseudocomata]
MLESRSNHRARATPNIRYLTYLNSANQGLKEKAKKLNLPSAPPSIPPPAGDTHHPLLAATYHHHFSVS